MYKRQDKTTNNFYWNKFDYMKHRVKLKKKKIGACVF